MSQQVYFLFCVIKRGRFLLIHGTRNTVVIALTKIIIINNNAFN